MRVETMKNIRRAVVAATVALSCVFAGTAKADLIQLGFILDSSGSIGSNNWNIIRSGLANAVNQLVPVGGPDTYEISVVIFSNNAIAPIQNAVLNDVSDRTSVVNSILALPYLNGTTNYDAAFGVMNSVLSRTISNADKSYVNFATDGNPNPSQFDGVVQRNAMIALGVDNISVEAIGFVDASFLQNEICYPGPCDSTIPFDFPDQGFFIAVANPQAYVEAIKLKISTVTGVPIPEPGTLALLGFGLAGLSLWRRKRTN